MTQTTLRLSAWHLVVWCTLAALMAASAVQACRTYNSIAGTDKTPQHIAWIALAVVTGPYVGPVANPGATDVRDQLQYVTAALVLLQLASLVPFVVVRRPVHWTVVVLAWLGFVGATLLWFFAAGLSLGHHLS